MAKNKATKKKSNKRSAAELDKSPRVTAWHFINSDHRLGYSDGRKVQVGRALSIPSYQKPMLCYTGMHASRKPSQAASYHLGPTLCKVEVWGDIDEKSGGNKLCGRHRKVLIMRDLTIDDCGYINSKLKNKSNSYLLKDLEDNFDNDWLGESSKDINKEWDEFLEQQTKNFINDNRVDENFDSAIESLMNTPTTQNPKYTRAVLPDLTEDTVKGLLSEDRVTTYHEIENLIKGRFRFNKDSLDNILSYNDSIRTIENHYFVGMRSYDSYVLKKKKVKLNKK